MGDFKKGLRLTGLAMREELRSIHFYVFLTIIFFVMQFCFSGVGKSLQGQNAAMNIFELYIAFVSTRTSQLLYLLGMLILTCGMNFFHTGAAYYLIRANKNVWVMGEICYLILICMFYNFFILLNLWVASGGLLYFSGEWSRAFFMACQFSPERIGMWPVVSFSYGVTANDPNSIGLCCLALSVFVGVDVGIAMAAFQQRNRLAYGLLCVMGLWYLDFLVEDIPRLGRLSYISPFGLSRAYRLSLDGAGPAFSYAVCFLLCIGMFLLYILQKQSGKVDFVKME